MTVTTENQANNGSNISEKWKEKFELLTKIGAGDKFIFSAMKSQEFKELSFKERQKVIFNWVAFIFGPFYQYFGQFFSSNPKACSFIRGFLATQGEPRLTNKYQPYPSGLAARALSIRKTVHSIVLLFRKENVV